MFSFSKINVPYIVGLGFMCWLVYECISEAVHSTTQLKYQKLQNDGIDRLNNLPDSILLLIISKLETKYAVATSLLSSRYKSLWRHVNSLRFSSCLSRDYGNIDDKRLRFSQFVNRVLILLESKSIHEFSLKIDCLYPVYDITTWVTAAVFRNLKVLKLDISEEQFPSRFIDIVMPNCFYTCKTLEVLEIRSKLWLRVPKFVRLPKLTVIRLHHVKFSPGDCFRRLISGCSSLEYLHVERNEYDNVGTLTINSPTLKSLYCTFLNKQRIVQGHFKFVLNAPKLRHIHLGDNISRDFVFNSLCPLENTDIRFESPPELNDPDSHYERVVKLLQRLYNVNHLWISGDTLEALSRVPAPQIDSKQSRSSVLNMGRNKFKKSLQDLLEGSDKSP